MNASYKSHFTSTNNSRFIDFQHGIDTDKD